MAQSGPGNIEHLAFMGGGEIPIADTVAAPINWDGFFKIVGDLAETDTGIVSIDKAGGWVRISNNNEDGKGAGFGTAVAFSPALNGTLVLETRIELAALTARNVFVGFTGLVADDVAEPATGATVTITYVTTHVLGFVFDSQLTDTTHWHMVHSGGSLAAGTVSTAIVASNDLITAAENQILRVEISPSGTVRWYVNNKLRQTKVGAASTTQLLGALVAAFGTTTTAADADVNYIYFKAANDWTI